MKPRLEKLASNQAQSFHCFIRQAGAFPFEWHFHPEMELTLILAGSGQRYVGDHVSPYRPGDLVLLGPNLPHAWASETPGGRTANRAVVLQWPTELTDQLVDSCGELQAVTTLLRHASRGVAFGSRSAKPLAARLTELAKDDSPRRVLRFLELLLQLAEIKSHTRLASPGFFVEPDEAQAAQIGAVCRWIHEHLEEPIRQSQAAAMLAMNVSTFSRFFKQGAGRTFTDYVNELRIGRASRLLIETDLPVTSIAYRCGFSDPAYFHRVFHQRRDVGPSAYRKRFEAR